MGAIAREDIFAYVRNKYRVTEDYPLPLSPNVPVMRRPDDRSWFATIEEVSREGIGFEGTGTLDILSLRMRDERTVDRLVLKPGIYRGHYLNRGDWVSVLLDETVPFEQVCALIDESFDATVPRRGRLRMREPKEVLLSCSPRRIDVAHVFDGRDEVWWKQGRGMTEGDVIYLYASSPISAILYQCVITQTTPSVGAGSPRMRIRLRRRYDPTEFTEEVLRSVYDIPAIRGPRNVPERLSEALRQ